MNNHTSKTAGFTLAELIIYAVILGIVAFIIGTFVSTSVKTTKRTERDTMSFSELRNITMRLDRDLAEANEFLVATSSCIEFIVDLSATRGFNDSGDFDSDGVNNERDTDMDNDASTRFFVSFASQWRVGYNLEDDDDDNDGNLDAKIRIYYDPATKTLMRGVSVNNAAYVFQEMGPASSCTFTFFGAKREDLGRNIDLDNNGVITAYEIDYVQPTTGHGNRNNRIETADELQYIALVHVYLSLDQNKDGITDSVFESEFNPILIQLKRRR